MVAALTASSEARYRLRIAISAYPTNAPISRVPVRILPWRLVWKKRKVWLPEGEKVSGYDYLF